MRHDLILVLIGGLAVLTVQIIAWSIHRAVARRHERRLLAGLQNGLRALNYDPPSEPIVRDVRPVR